MDGGDRNHEDLLNGSDVHDHQQKFKKYIRALQGLHRLHNQNYYVGCGYSYTRHNMILKIL